jgi:DNA-binding LacI/PurR family transcriptional regulator
LTTVKQDKYKLGRMMAERIIKSVQEKKITNEKVVIPVELIIRESTGKIS